MISASYPHSISKQHLAIATSIVKLQDGYREGNASKAKSETYRAHSAGGEFAGGFEDGYFGRCNTGQRYTKVPVKDYSCNCRLIIRCNNLDSEY